MGRLNPFMAWPLDHPRCSHITAIKIYITHILQTKANSCVQTKLINHNIAYTFTNIVRKNDMNPLLNTQSINITHSMVKQCLHTIASKAKMKSTSMPMGYGTIASNGAAHSSKAQNIV